MPELSALEKPVRKSVPSRFGQTDENQVSTSGSSLRRCSPRGSRRDRLKELQFAVFDRDDGRALGGVALFVNRRDAAGAGKVFRRGDRVAKLCTFGGSGASD